MGGDENAMGRIQRKGGREGEGGSCLCLPLRGGSGGVVGAGRSSTHYPLAGDSHASVGAFPGIRGQAVGSVNRPPLHFY